MTAQMTDTLKIGRRYVSVKYSETIDFDEKTDFIARSLNAHFIRRFSIIANPPLPEKNPHILENEDYDIIYSSNWRGYNACWEIKKDSKLYLIKLSGRLKLNEKKTIFADWMTGLLYFEQGDSSQNRNFQEIIVVTVKNGYCESVSLFWSPKKIESYGVDYLVDYFGLED